MPFTTAKINYDPNTAISDTELNLRGVNINLLAGAFGNFSVTWTSYTVSQNTTIYYRLLEPVDPASNYRVEMTLAAVSGTSNDAFMISSGTPVPALIRPSASLLVPIIGIDNGNPVSCGLNIAPTGGLTMFIDNGSVLDNNTWTNSGSKGYYASIIQYPI